MAILEAADYPLVRAALGPRVTATDLPDATIENDLYLGAATDEVVARLPDAEDVAADDTPEGRRVKRATAYLTAANVLARSPNVTAARFADTAISTPAERDERVAALRASAEDALGDLVTPGGGEPLSLFWLVSGRRGR